MSEYKKPTNEKEFEENFKQKKPLMNSTEAYYESSRCLFCYDAPCINACPTGIDIPLFIKQIQTKNTEGSAKTIYDSNWMGNACAKVCPTGVLCEGACVYNHQGVPAIQIGRLQNFATDQVIRSNVQLYKAGAPNGKKVAIIGAGPAGLSAACELRVLGFEVEVFEAKSKPTGLTLHGTAPYKITNEDAFKEAEYLQNMLQYKVHYNSAITSKEQLTKLENDFDAIFLGLGLGPTAELNIKGDNLENVIGAVEFIEELREKHHETKVGDKVIVLGGGNTAMDAASETARMGASEVTLAYRRSKEEMGAYGFEYDLIKAAGAKSLFNASPLEIIGTTKVEGVKFAKTKVIDGKLQNIPNSEFIVACDMVIKATGQAKMGAFLSLIDGLALVNSVIQVNKDYQTSNPKYFAGGDAINGGAEVVNGAFDGKMAARGIQKMIFGN